MSISIEEYQVLSRYAYLKLTENDIPKGRVWRV